MKTTEQHQEALAFGVIDCHTHRYPPELFADPAGWAQARGEEHWVLLVGPRADGKPTLQGFADRDEMLRAMDEGGVARCVLLGWYWEKHETCVWHNEWMARWVREDPDRFSAFASVQPRAGSAALNDLKKARDAGFCGVGEVFPLAQGFAMDDPQWQIVLEWAESEKLPVNLHVSDPAGRRYPGYMAAPLSEYLWLARKHPRVNFIFAHWGGGLALSGKGEITAYNEEDKIARQVDLRDYRNIYFDTAASPLLYDAKVYRQAVDAVGADRILFGTDYPLRVFPKWDKPGFARPLAEVRAAHLKMDELGLILRDNAATLGLG